jgi:hypothetical protein
MKNFKTYFLFILAISFLTVQFRQVIVIAHFYVFQEEIIEQHCENKDQPDLQCNGQCHLAKELKKTAAIESVIVTDERPSAPPVAIWFNFYGMIFWNNSNSPAELSIIHASPFRPLFYAHLFQSNVFTPPKIS